MDNICFVFVGIHLLFSFIKFSTAVDAITQTQFVSDGRSLTSKDGSFELGFFSPANSSSRFLGIWNRKIPLRTVSWVANVHKPINDSSGILMINSTGNAVILSQNTTVVWSTSSSKQAVNPILQLLDSGNLARWVSVSASEDICDSYGLCGPLWSLYQKWLGQSRYGYEGMQGEMLKGNCSCIAFASSDAKGDSACSLWFSDLIDIRRLLNGGGQDLYVRMPASELETHNGVKVKIAAIIIACCFYCLWPVVICLLYSKKQEKCLKNIENIDIYGITGQTNKDFDEMGTLSFTLLSTIFLLIFFTEVSWAADTISGTQSITGNSTLVSKDGNFEMGFFSPGGSTNWYVGIWYKDIPAKAVVWVANRQNPINDSSGTLMINSTGHLVLSQKSGVVWSANPARPIQTPILQLRDSGNLVSFDYPCDTLLPGMKLGWDLKTGLQRRLVSWKSSDDPSPGDLTWEIDINNYPESVMFRGSEKYYRGGPWNGLRFSGAPELKPNPLFKFEFVFNEDEVYYTYNLLNNSAKSRIVVNQTNGYTRDRYAWNSVTQSWDVFATVPRDKCDKYALCGAYGNCIIGESPVCQCLEGFKPKGNLMDRSQGCIRNKPFNCQDKDSSGFKNEAYCVDSCASFASHCCGVWGVLGCSLHPQKKNALKCTLQDSLALKRPISSGQGQNEFKNEVILIAKLQH
ncbi:hypothetical protein FEM48_Zijuj01G0214700 [Ziziphus jujuba var. spinosa]|uniref:Bulb-type lectin domain-containing protein n=1 Tax=Ziziphus jujuba var. spinosa TaxID=714518 RepID=A0A978W3N5_ZIZJJ|nr:hypothetical protein FEM48_Zijuj01G0214700 [Ziziphus jujuba var. spinosa]